MSNLKFVLIVFKVFLHKLIRLLYNCRLLISICLIAMVEIVVRIIVLQLSTLFYTSLISHLFLAKFIILIYLLISLRISLLSSHLIIILISFLLSLQSVLLVHHNFILIKMNLKLVRELFRRKHILIFNHRIVL